MSGAVFVTASGRVIDILDPDWREISFEDIALHLSRTCRYAGAVRVPHYSNAQHSCLVADCAEKIAPQIERVGIYAQLHDGHEYAIGDVNSVLERTLDLSARTHIESIRLRLDNAIFRAAGLPPMAHEIWKAIVEAHERVFAAECRFVSHITPPLGVTPAVNALSAWSQPKAEEMFIKQLNARAVRDGVRIKLRAA
jgi:hypothetical protein